MIPSDDGVPVSDTIFAISSGSPPAAIAVVRLSGPHALAAVGQMAGPLPSPRRASVRTLRDADGTVLDEALVLTFPAPNSATGEDCAELHCHGGRAVVAAVAQALAASPGLRAADAGEFTRRAFINGRIDLAQAEALGDLLMAETELQRRAAQAGVGGALSSQVQQWREEVLSLSALVEATLDFADDDDADELPGDFAIRIASLHAALRQALAAPRTERLREGLRVVLAGPPNSGKSSLFNVLLKDSAAIVSVEPGTTRDVLERSVAISGVPFVLVDTAGLREDAAGAIEAIGIKRAREQLGYADIVLWLGPEGDGPPGALEVQSLSDDMTAPTKRNPDHVVSSVNGLGIEELLNDLVIRAKTILPKPGSVMVNTRQAELLGIAEKALRDPGIDPLLVAESLREARLSFDRLLGSADVEDMLDTLFSRFCVGK